MADLEKQLAWFADSYHEETGEHPRRFVCPITLKDEPDAELCDGHILCQSIAGARRDTVPQRKDVDNAFGTLFEGDFVRLVNLRNQDSDALLQGIRNLEITGPSGEKMPAFFSRAKITGRQQLNMYDKAGNVVAQPYLKQHKLDVGNYKQLEVVFTHWFKKHSFTAAMVKVGYLTMFKLFGYRWVFDSCGDKIRRALLACLEASSRKTALAPFAVFEGCAQVMFNQDMNPSRGTLETGDVLFRYAEGTAESGLLFGITGLYWTNGTLLAVTLPAYQRAGHHFVAVQHYDEFLRKSDGPYSMHLGRIHDGQVEIGRDPVPVGYTADFPPTVDNTQ